MNDVLQPHLPCHFWCSVGGGGGGNAGFGFQQDNVRPCSAGLTKPFLQQTGVVVMQCMASLVARHELPAACVGRSGSYGSPTPPGTLQTQLHLIAVLQQDWNVILVTVQCLVRSMPRRFRACLGANGSHTLRLTLFYRVRVSNISAVVENHSAPPPLLIYDL